MKGLLLYIIVALFYVSAEAIWMRIVEAGVAGGIKRWRRGPFLGRKVTLCPPRVFGGKFTIICRTQTTSRRTTRARFFVNERLFNTEYRSPFTLTPSGSAATPWTGYPSMATIRCALDNGEEIISTITFRCSNEGLASSSPRVVAPSPTPIATALPEAIASDPSLASTCVKIPASNVGKLTAGWQRSQGGLAFKKNDNTRKLTPRGVAALEYSFTAPTSGRYAFTIDMETSGRAEHNDVWVEFPDGGWMLKRAGSTTSADGWTKAYQNKNGRAISARSVDNNPHYFSTRKILSRGESYTVLVGGRSSKVTVFSLILFPCAGDGCQDGAFWRSSVARCA